MMTEIMRQTQNPRHVTTTHLGGRFADLAIECGCLVNDQNTRLGAFTLQHERGCCAGKRAPDYHDVVIELHRRSQIERSMIETQSVCIRLFICNQILASLSIIQDAPRLVMIERLVVRGERYRQ
jgi:hypothetical protein